MITTPPVKLYFVVLGRVVLLTLEIRTSFLDLHAEFNVDEAKDPRI